MEATSPIGRKLLQLTQEKNLIDPTKLNIKTAEEYQLDSAISKIIMVATPDPKPLPLKALQSLESKRRLKFG